jgi:hypothetical protein
MIYTWHFWLNAIILGPLFWLILLCIGGFGLRQLKAISTWYFGLPINQWPAMCLLVIACKVLKSKRYCHFMTYDGRFWLSPNVDGFKTPDLSPVEITPK